LRGLRAGRVTAGGLRLRMRWTCGRGTAGRVRRAACAVLAALVLAWAAGAQSTYTDERDALDAAAHDGAHGQCS
jgi:hypothetical protein